MKFIQGIAAACLLLLGTLAAHAQSSYRVQAGDLLSIEVLEDTSLNRRVLVLPDGSFSFPFAGSLRAAGRTVDQIKAAITSAIGSNFAVEPTVFVSIEPTTESFEAASGPAQIDIYFMGEFNSQGTMELDRGTTLLQALAASGGLTRFAATKRIQLRRGSKAYKFNYHALINGGSAGGNPVLRDGDVIVAPERRLFE